MEKKLKIGLAEAISLLAEVVQPLKAEELPLAESVGRVLAEDPYANVDSPSVDGSLKDGYGIVSQDIAGATTKNPVRLNLATTVHAGEEVKERVDSGYAARLFTGAEIPPGVEAVVAEEFTWLDGENLYVMNNAEPGRNILYRGSDIGVGELIARGSTLISPGLLGLLAAAGHSILPVVRTPSIAIIASGDEVVAPGRKLPKGKLYASNITTLAGWCHRYGFAVSVEVVADKADRIEKMISRFHLTHDAIITSGGAWTGDHDLVAKVLESMGGKRIFHRLRIGPGKASGLVMLANKPVFILPGGPPSNLMGFLQIALPGLMRLAGRTDALPTCVVRLSQRLHTQFRDWTQFYYGGLEPGKKDAIPIFSPIRNESRLRSMAEADAVVALPEGETELSADQLVMAQSLLKC